MPFNFDDLNPPKRFYWPEDEAGDEWVELYIATRNDIRTIFKTTGIKQKQEYKLNTKTNRMERIEFIDTTEDKAFKFEEEMIALKIIDWNIKDVDGKLIPCNKDNKIKLVRGHPKFAAWVDECVGLTMQETETFRGEQEKN